MNGSKVNTQKRQFTAMRGKHNHKKSRTQPKGRSEGSNDEVLRKDVQRLLATARADQSPTDREASSRQYEPPERFAEIDVRIQELASTGDGLGLSSDKNHVYVVPFTVPGDVVRAKVVNHKSREGYTISDFVKVLEPSPRRDDSRIKCRYFARCGGCAFQMLSYEDQLAHKKTIIEHAYQNFSDLVPESVPAIEDTMGSPLQYGYRTKLTPHFDKPPGPRRRKDGEPRPQFAEVPPIGYNYKNRNLVLDVEECPIGTEVLNAGMTRERANIAERLEKYTKGATILLRESTTRTPRVSDEGIGASTAVADASVAGAEIAYDESKVCITDNNATSTEYVDGYVFQNPAGAFFQNNNSILPGVTRYVRERILPPGHAGKITTLLDAYCGSALFTITLASLFTRSIGIDISASSIEFARTNARLNGAQNATFHAATASAIFAELPDGVRPDDTAVVIDPPRKGCDESFLRQLLAFGPRRVCYVSCNVHTQARDVGVLVEGLVAADPEVREEQPGGDGTAKAPEKRTRYRIESIRGFDFFPQTSHVESVAILERVDEDRAEESRSM